MDPQLLKTANRKQQNIDNVLLFVENYDIKLEILNKLTHLNQSETQKTVMSDLFFSEGFSLVHEIITTIIRSPLCILYIQFHGMKNFLDLLQYILQWIYPGTRKIILQISGYKLY